MKKLCAVLLCALLLLPIFAGCAAAGDQPLPTLSDEKKEQIKKDYIAYENFTDYDVTDEVFWETPWLQYYGSYNGYDVFLDPFEGRMTAQVFGGVEIGGENFIFHHSFSIIAYKDGKFQNLNEVYEAGGITKQHIKQIAAYHRNAYPQYYEQ